MSERTESPRANKEFSFYWSVFIDDVEGRDNFKPGHLQQLKILCQLYTEFDKITEDINEKGYTYETDPSGESRYGSQVKIRVEVTQRDKIMSEIRQYSKLLSLVVEKDKEMTKKEDVFDEWD